MYFIAADATAVRVGRQARMGRVEAAGLSLAGGGAATCPGLGIGRGTANYAKLANFRNRTQPRTAPGNETKFLWAGFSNPANSTERVSEKPANRKQADRKRKTGTARAAPRNPSGPSANTNSVAQLGLAVSDPPTQMEMQALASKLDELISAL
jgi:hypothetical protein